MNNSVAIISDIHGNAHALRAVLQDIADHGINERVCLGDVVGYGGSPGDCIDLLMEHGIPCVQGNHDAMVTTGVGLDGVKDATRSAIEWTRSVLSPEQIGWLDALPLTMQAEDYEAVHASLHFPVFWPYVLIAEMAALHFAPTSASRRMRIGTVPACPASPRAVTRMRLCPTMPVTMPSGRFEASSTGPCSICTST